MTSFNHRSIISSLLIAAASLVLAAVAHAEQPAKPGPPAPPPPLRAEQVYDMVSSGVNSVDILVEANARLLAFVVGPDVIKELEDRGADDLLLNWLGLYSVELQPLYKTCLADQEQQRYSRVVEVTSELLDRSPRLLHIYLMRGSAYRAQDKHNEAAADFRTALKFHRNSSRARVLLAETLIADNSTDEAIELLNWVIEHRSAAGIQDWPTAHRLLAEAYLKLRDYQSASRELHTALWQLPYPNPEAVKFLPPLESHMSALARLLALCPDPDIASPQDAIEIAQLMKLMALDKDQQQIALLRLAEGQAAAGKFDEAVATQKAAEILSTGTATPAIRERLALYEQKQLPLLPPGKKSDGDSSNDSKTPDPLPAPSISIAALLDQMQKIEDKSDDSSADDAPKPFYLGKLEVTRGQWASVMGNPAPQSPDLPVDRISWDDCQTFLKKLNEKSGPDGPRFRLPTLSEWQFAAQAGSKQPFFFGDDAAVVSSYGWCSENASRSLHPGKGLRENPLGLYDIYGNVAEWCQDESSPLPDTKSPVPFRTVAGGSFLSSPALCSSQVAGFARQNESRRGLGFRLAADLSGETPPANPTPEEPPQVTEQKPASKNHRAGLNLAIDLARSTIEVEVFQRTWLQERLYALLYLQACVRDTQGDIETSVENLRSLIRELPDEGNPLIHVARCHLAWIQATRDSATPEQIAEARKIAEGALSRTEFTLWIGYLTKSAVLVAEKDFEDAARQVAKASDLAPQQFKEICTNQLKAIQDRKASMTREFPISPSVSPATIITR
ncbi:MAG: SUMF1/EgtB/PvdO family nonheme iron enzyme [Planctomycetaceae bacterium]|nr:SUMF1/EgtB/PvdO family nonheme iron enzyme [Planctomycetaceae bacterium]